MQGRHGRSIEAQEAAALEDAVDNGLRQIIVVQHAAHVFSDLLVVKIIGRCRRCRSFTTWKSMLAASVPYVR